jgi:hypothetical protein
MLLVAKRRKRRTGEGGKLVAERCWPLNEITLMDVKDSNGKPIPTFRLLARPHCPFRCNKSLPNTKGARESCLSMRQER